MVTELEYGRFRRSLSGSETSMPDEYIDTVFADAESDYDGSVRKVIVLAAILQGARELRAAAVRYTDYTQNQTKESLSQIFKHLDSLVTDFKQQLEEASAKDTLPSVMWGRGKNVPTRIREYPDDGA